MKYYLGIDGGGTKTSFLLLDEWGCLVSEYTMGTGSYKQIGVEGVVHLLGQGILKVKREGRLTKTDKIASCFGMPMFGEDEECDKKIEELISKELDNCHIRIVNDAEVGWAGSFGLDPGINIVAGTGSIAYGRNSVGDAARAGGWSDFFGDEGSCYWLGKKAIELFSKEADNRVSKGALYDVIRGRFKLEDDFEIVPIIEEGYKEKRDEVASLQMLLFEAALQKDEGAVELYRQAAYELSLIIKAVAKSLGGEEAYSVSYSGGLFKTGAMILDPLKSYFDLDKITFAVPIYSPSYGAALLAAYDADGMEKVKEIRLKG